MFVGAGQHMICSDCYDNANIYSRTREYCPYTYMTEEDPMDQTLSSFMSQVPKETFLSLSNEVGASAAKRNMSAFLNYDRKEGEKPSCGKQSVFSFTSVIVNLDVFWKIGFL